MTAHSYGYDEELDKFPKTPKKIQRVEKLKFFKQMFKAHLHHFPSAEGVQASFVYEIHVMVNIFLDQI